MLKKLFFILLLMFFIPLIFVQAARYAPLMSISLNKEQFKPGDEIKVDIIFTNNFSQQIKGILTCGFVSYDNTLPPMPKMLEINLAPGEKINFDCSMMAGETMPDGLYKAMAEARDENNNLIAENTKEFSITGAKKEIKADLLVCKNENCDTNQAVFSRGETVHLKLITNILDLEIKSSMEDNKTKEKSDLIFKNNKARITAAKEGSYMVNLILNKNGYSEQIMQKDFAVISEPAKINSESQCDTNGKCSGQENEQNCPQDCVKVKKSADKTVILIVAIAIITAIMIVAYYFLIRKKSIPAERNER